MPLLCRNCGQAQVQGERFCPKCGGESWLLDSLWRKRRPRHDAAPAPADPPTPTAAPDEPETAPPVAPAPAEPPPPEPLPPEADPCDEVYDLLYEKQEAAPEPEPAEAGETPDPPVSAAPSPEAAEPAKPKRRGCLSAGLLCLIVGAAGAVVSRAWPLFS